MRLIDADVLKQMVPTTSVDMFENCSNCSLLSEEQVLELIDMTPTIDMWIPCSERLPAYGEDVLISIGGYCNVGHIVPVNEEEQYNWYFSGWYHLPNDVDAWMPLPEPYKENSDGH